jgi:hypothetical protein
MGNIVTRIPAKSLLDPPVSVELLLTGQDKLSFSDDSLYSAREISGPDFHVH